MLPELTHLQFALLSILLEHDGQEVTGRELREALKKEKKMGLAAFYRLMARMEDGDVVKGRYEQRSIEGQGVRERVYKISATGTTAVEDAVLFYASRSAQTEGI